MPARCFCVLLVFCAGCRTLWPSFGTPRESCAQDEEGVAEDGGPEACSASCRKRCARPKVECKPQEEYHVNAPRQRVVVQRAALPAQAAAQQVVNNRQVILVPQRVLVPYVQSTSFGAVRLGGVQQTQVLGSVGAAGTAAGESSAAVTAASGSATSQALNGTANGQRTEAESPEDLRNQLELLEQQVQELKAEVKALRKR